MQYPLTELGYFSERDCKFIKTVMDGSTFMHFNITYCNVASNCILIVETDYKATETEIKNMFLHAALGKLALFARIF